MSENESRVAADSLPEEVSTTSARRSRVRILDVFFDRIDLRDTMAMIRDACETRDPLHIVTVNLNFLTIGRRNRAFVQLLNNARLSVTDGKILQWVAWLIGEPVPEQITGHDLFRESVKLAAEKNYGIFLLGGAPGVAQEVAEKIARENPGLRAFGTHHGVFSADGHTDKQGELEKQILDFKPDLLFAALGTPKQEWWIARHIEELGIPVAIGVGCVFDVVGGHIKRVPRWAQRAGLESAIQLLYAPRRYAKRYLIDDPPTLMRIAGYIIRKRLFKEIWN